MNELASYEKKVVVSAVSSLLTDYQLKSLGQATAKAVLKFYKDPDNMKKFEEWYLKEYGHPYEQKEG